MPRDPEHRATPTWRAALAGVLGVGVALAVVELLSATTRRIPSAIEAVGQQVIPRTPQVVTRWAIETFGTSDIAVLNGGTTVIALLIGAAAGIAARRHLGAAVAVFALFAAAGLLAADGEANLPAFAAALVVGVLAGLATLRWLLRPPPTATGDPAASSTAAGLGRRGFLTGAAAVAAAAVVAVGTGRFVLRSALAVVDPGEVALPPPARALPPPAEAAALDVDGISPLFTPNDRFYVIDTAVAVPQIAPEDWSLRIHGLVDRELVLTYDQLLAEPLVEVDATIACVSNEVGGDLVGNARWLGVRLDTLLERVGVRADAEQILGRSSDAFTAGFPVEAGLDGRDAIVAVAMNGEPLPTRHGFPARLIVPGLYGYVSATKWLAEIELTTWDVEGFWVPRGWSREGPIKTQSRVDVPASGASVASGEVVVAGIAFAPTRGIDAVEIRLDDADWQEAELADAVADTTWRQWIARVQLEPGDHVVQVRARDGEGGVQRPGPRPPAPDGAEGYDRATFRVA